MLAVGSAMSVLPSLTPAASPSQQPSSSSSSSSSHHSAQSLLSHPHHASISSRAAIVTTDTEIQHQQYAPVPATSTSSLQADPITTSTSASASTSTATPSKPLLIVGGKVIASPTSLGTSGGRLKKFICPECGQGYTRPTRLQEHQRVHSGERPFKCAECPSTFTRDSHLKAHARIHASEQEKRYDCDECDKKFWTHQHLKKHVQTIHKGKTYDCSQCDESFRKHHLLRTHIAEVHSTPGTFPFICDAEGCDKSFKQKTHLTAHRKTHDRESFALVRSPCSQGNELIIGTTRLASRYLCIHRDCSSLRLSQRQHATWSALQKHTKTVHPPRCHYPECDNKTFTTNRGLRNHIATIHEGSTSAEDTDAPHKTTTSRSRRKRKRRSGRARGSDEEPEARETETDADDGNETSEWEPSEWDREDDEREQRMLRDFAAGGKKKRRIVLAPEAVWKCTHGACKRSFKSSDALGRHVKALHSIERLVPVVEVPVHRPRSQSRGTSMGPAPNKDDLDSAQDSTDLEALPPLPPLPKRKRVPKSPTAMSLIESITGYGYAPAEENEGSQAASKRQFPCPWPDIAELDHRVIVDDILCSPNGHTVQTSSCEYWFSRVYDVERHLRGAHQVVVEREELEQWFDAEWEEEG
ncbi:BZ3500_MvSof-1268-A1-R1_Chr2-3g05320 [Microbotryum saponariae]|uniref:BZ3500_MvSof-1268-A1-R1_Chr2-3g05320 protein n=1 Tax=Microbotryum saponariae TaxID=289078 RepID=A0A2X0K518_9BASI|nr:BZ3500_MvSof-1268-A1-R1_Chr2-3g05320 [Microbotryum saponariae]